MVRKHEPTDVGGVRETYEYVSFLIRMTESAGGSFLGTCLLDPSDRCLATVGRVSVEGMDHVRRPKELFRVTHHAHISCGVRKTNDISFKWNVVTSASIRCSSQRSKHGATRLVDPTPTPRPSPTSIEGSTTAYRGRRRYQSGQPFKLGGG